MPVRQTIFSTPTKKRAKIEKFGLKKANLTNLDKRFIAFACVANNKTFKTEAVAINQLNIGVVSIIPKTTNHSELFKFFDN